VGQDCLQAEKCMPWVNDGGSQWNATRCSPVGGRGQPGDPCTAEGSAYSGVDDCALGVMCWRVDPATNEGTCHQLCSAVEGQPICPDGFVCSQPYGYALPICVTPCDPLAPDCLEGEGCYPAGATFGCLPTLSPVVPDGQTCEWRTQCEAGSLCADAALLETCDGDRCCTPLCATEGPPSCAGCTPYFDAAIDSPIGLCP
jgi:hypothetical protein